MKKRRVGIIGATGSIGRQALDVVLRNKDRFDVVYLSAHENEKGLSDAAQATGAKITVLTALGMDGLVSIVKNEPVDVVIVGASGTQVLIPTYELAKTGTVLGIANKECLVAAGRIIMKTAIESGTSVVPVDSEHSALFQCLSGQDRASLHSLTLTASGGAFRDYTPEQMKDVTVADALKHPNWVMGRKITIDSATMMNKGLELIEAHMLFGVEPSRLNVVIHPESIVHSMVSYIDGSTLAQLGYPDMRAPISYALNYPQRIDSGVDVLDFSKVMRLNFFPPDMNKYPCLGLAVEVLRGGRSSAMIAMNAANEMAVAAFLNESIKYFDIYKVVASVVGDFFDRSDPLTISEVVELDLLCRLRAQQQIQRC